MASSETARGADAMGNPRNQMASRAGSLATLLYLKLSGAR